jgi:hypothetical protein
MKLKPFFCSLALVCVIAFPSYAQKSKTFGNDDFNSSSSSSSKSSSSSSTSTSSTSSKSSNTPKLYVDPSLSYKADVNYKDNSGTQTGKVFIDKGSFRVEMKLKDESVIIISNASISKSYLLSPEKKIYAPADGYEQIFALFLGQSDPQFQEKVGNETINGQACDKYLLHGGVTFGDTYLWVNQQTKIPVRLTTTREQFDWTNVSVGSQPANLFQIPTGYKNAFDFGK